MSLQRLSSRREEQVGQKREWCSSSWQAGFAVGFVWVVVSSADVGCIRRY